MNIDRDKHNKYVVGWLPSVTPTTNTLSSSLSNITIVYGGGGGGGSATPIEQDAFGYFTVSDGTNTVTLEARVAKDIANLSIIGSDTITVQLVSDPFVKELQVTSTGTNLGSYTVSYSKHEELTGTEEEPVITVTWPLVITYVQGDRLQTSLFDTLTILNNNEQVATYPQSSLAIEGDENGITKISVNTECIRFTHILLTLTVQEATEDLEAIIERPIILYIPTLEDTKITLSGSEASAYWKLDELGNLYTEYNAYSTKELSAYGWGGEGTPGGGGASFLRELNDVSLPETIPDNSILQYNSATQAWEAVQAGDLGGSVTQQWVQDYVEGVVSPIEQSIENLLPLLDWFSFVDGKIRANYDFFGIGEVSAYGIGDGQAPQGKSYLRELEDVLITSLSDNQILMYDADALKWVNVNKDEVGLNETELGNYLNSHNYIKKSDMILNNILDMDSTWKGLLSASPTDYVLRWPTFAEVTDKPTTLAGYGITDAYTKDETDDRYVNITGDTMTGNLLLPTLDASVSVIIGNAKLEFDSANNALKLSNVNTGSVMNFYATGEASAYGLGDGSAATGAGYLHELGDVVLTSLSNGQLLQYDATTLKWVNIDKDLVGLNEAELAQYLTTNKYLQDGDITWANLSGKPSIFSTNIANIADLNAGWDSILAAAPTAYVTRWPSFSEVTNKPSTLSGYGITDGVNAVSITGSGNAVTSASISGHTLTLTKDYSFAYTTGTNATGTWGISISGNAATASKWATARTITLNGSVTGSVSIDGSGNVTLTTTYTTSNISALDGRYVNITGDTMTGNLILPTLQANTSIILGSIKLEYDSTNNALKVSNIDSNAVMNLYATGEVAAYGFGSGTPGSGTVDSLDDIGDVTLSGLKSNDIIVWNGSNWVNTPLSSIEINIDDFVTIATALTITATKTFTQPIIVNVSTNTPCQEGLSYYNGSTILGAIGAVHNGSTIQYMQLNPHGVLDGIGGLVVGDELGFNGYLVFHSGNTVIPTVPDVSGFVKKTGDTMSGNLSFANIATWPTASGETYPINSAGLTWSGSSDTASIFYRVSASDLGNLVLQTGDDNSANIVFENTVTGTLATLSGTGNLDVKSNITINGLQVLHANNYTNYTVTKTGGGASGTWPISITGNAVTATKLNSRGNLTALTGLTMGETGFSLYQVYNNGYPVSFGNVLHVRGIGAGELLMAWSGTDGGYAGLYYRNHRDNEVSANWSSWVTILDSSNYASTLDSHYVNISGDTMTGSLLFSDSGTTTREVRFQGGTNDFGRIAFGATAANAGWLEIASADDGNEPVYVRLYSGTFASIVRTLTLLDGSGNSTFPGLVTINNKMTLNSSTTDTWITILLSGTSKGSIGYISGLGTYLWNTTASSRFYLTDDKRILFNNGSVNTVWHSGNDGSGSGLDADLLDGWQLSTLLGYGYSMKLTQIDAHTLDANTWYPVTIPLGNRHSVLIAITNGLDNSYQASWSTHNSRKISVRKIWIVNGSGWGTSPINRQVFVSDSNWVQTDPVRGVNQMSNSSTEYVYVRGGADYYFYTSHNVTPVLRTSTYTISSLSVAPTTSAPAVISRNIAYLTDNVASATLLQTARTIWGQSFNGTADVSGALSNVSGVNFNGTNGVLLTNTGSVKHVANSTAAWWGIHKADNTAIFCANSSTGNICIGNNSNPSYKLYVMGTGCFSSTLTVTGAINLTNGECHFAYGSYSDPASGVSCSIKAAGNVAVGGNMIATGEVTAYSTSDIRLKTNIHHLSALDIVRRLNVVEYDWNATALLLKADKTVHGYGLIALEIETIIPEVVTHNMYSKGYLGIDYLKLVPFALSAIQEVDDEVTMLKKRVTELEHRLSKYEHIN